MIKRFIHLQSHTKGKPILWTNLKLKKSSIVGRDSSDLIKAVRKEDYKDVFNALIEWR